MAATAVVVERPAKLTIAKQLCAKMVACSMVRRDIRVGLIGRDPEGPHAHPGKLIALRVMTGLSQPKYQEEHKQPGKEQRMAERVPTRRTAELQNRYAAVFV